MQRTRYESQALTIDEQFELMMHWNYIKPPRPEAPRPKMDTFDLGAQFYVNAFKLSIILGIAAAGFTWLFPYDRVAPENALHMLWIVPVSIFGFLALMNIAAWLSFSHNYAQDMRATGWHEYLKWYRQNIFWLNDVARDNPLVREFMLEEIDSLRT